ncbi:MAG: Do family serine endopeptidase [Gammaproteobacteria bacterium]|nr:MAG: Do family serine endopeptidase [Gammaproteobacteria bacterium]
MKLPIICSLILLTLLLSATNVFAGLPNSVDGQPLPTLAPMLERTTPSVVNISTTGKVMVRGPFFDDPFFRRFFDVPQQQRERRTTGLGSGVIIDARNGYVVTNSHVIDKAQDIVVTLEDGQRFDAQVIGKDPGADIAVIQIDATNLKEISLGNSDDLRQGDFVVAIGNPFGLGQTVTSGIVSALGRSGLGIESYEDFIQTDASINPGNSGGALVNLRGELIGINTAIYGPSGGNVGIGFAIPMNMAKQIMQQLIEHGEVKRGRIGFSAQDLTPELAEAFGINRNKGVVARVEADSPADKAGMKVGDVIIEVNGKEVQSSGQVRNEIGLLRIGSHVKIEVLRNGKSRTLTATVEDQVTNSVAGVKLSKRLAGAEFGEVREETSRGSISGIEVLSASGKAASAGLRKGDIILSVNKKRVKSIGDMKTAIKRNADAMLLNIQRDSRGLFLLIQ